MNKRLKSTFISLFGGIVIGILVTMIPLSYLQRDYKELSNNYIEQIGFKVKAEKQSRELQIQIEQSEKRITELEQELASQPK